MTMKEFMFVFRADFKNMPRTSPEEMQAQTKRWMDWIGGIAAQNKLVSRGNRLSSGGKVLKGNDIITDGPYTEIKESIGGYCIVKADTFDGAISLAKGCPVLNAGGNVEIREIDQL